MPRRRHTDKRRWLDPYSGAEVWADVFRSGAAMFDDFPIDSGVQMDRSGRVPLEAAEAAWRTYGSTFLALYDRTTPQGQPVWALETFGEPHGA
jgi:hypothetical protein